MKLHRLMRLLLAVSLPLFFTVTVNVHAAGFQRVMAPDPDGAPLEVGIWYPSKATPTPLSNPAVTQSVAIGGPIDGNMLPLIVISHGTGGSYLGHADTAMALANAGFVVAAVTHTGDNYADQSRNLFIMERARHISRMLDYLLSNWSGRERIDPARIGIFGFSAGGYTALVSIGGNPDMAKISSFCQARPTDFVCQLTNSHAGSAAVAKPGPAGTRDDRIKAAVIAAPALGFTFAPDGLADVTIPVQLWRAENDTILPHPWYAQAVKAALPRPPDYHVVANAGHFDFLAPCNAFLTDKAPEICTSAPGFDRKKFHDVLNSAIVDFFEASL